MAHPKLYALLVGINTYARPLIPSLRGTHQDVTNLQQYLQEHYAQSFDLDIKILQDEAATRGHIIEGLEQHLGQAQEKDVALFFFAGHGSWEKEQEAFSGLGTLGIEKTLVCHDSRTSKKYDLAEKELLVLLDYIGRNKATTIVILDTCHATKFESHPKQTIRLFEGLDQSRKIEHYLYDTTVDANKFYYYKQLLRHKAIKQLPTPSYVAYYATNALEYAKEKEQGGWFTQLLLEALKENQTPQTYFQVYNTLLSKMVDQPSQQTPTFRAYNQFDVNKNFISGSTSTSKTKRFRVVKEANKTSYQIQFGAQLGFPVDIQNSISFNLFADKDSTTVLGTGEVQFLGVKDSPIHLSLPSMDYQEFYWAELLDFTLAPLLVGFMGAPEDLELLNQTLQQQDIQQLLFVPNSKACPFYIIWQEAAQSYQLYEKGRPIFILEFSKASLENADLMALLFSTLEHLHQWYSTIHLSNPKSAIAIDDLQLTFYPPVTTNTIQCVYHKRGEAVETDLKSANEYPQTTYTKVLLEVEEEELLEYRVAIANNSFSQHYYVAYVLVSADYGVFPLGINIPLPIQGSIPSLIDPTYSSLSISRAQDTHLTNHLKVIISKEKLPTTEGFMLEELQLEQSLEFLLTSRMVAPKRVKIFDWQTCGLTFSLEKKA